MAWRDEVGEARSLVWRSKTCKAVDLARRCHQCGQIKWPGGEAERDERRERKKRESDREERD